MLSFFGKSIIWIIVFVMVLAA